MSGEVEKCPILHVCPKFDVLTLVLARSNFDHYVREWDFGILKEKKQKQKKTKHKKQEKSFGCVFLSFYLYWFAHT